ncbi:hypothetical protein, partial [Mycobacterium kubicae]
VRQTQPRKPAHFSTGAGCSEFNRSRHAQRLQAELGERGVKIGIATSVLSAQWDQAQIYPVANSSLLVVSEAQRRQLEMFACD